MSLTRRNALALGTAAIAVTLVPLRAFAASEKSMEAIKAFAGDVEITDGNFDLTTPEIAENGNTVPVNFSAPGAKRVMLLADGNPSPGVASFNFGALSDSSGSTRIRLAGTQNVIAVAEMADGSIVQVAKAVKVTIGGCGG